jgi:intracellular septation protein A
MSSTTSSPKRLRVGAIAIGAIAGVAGVPLCYVLFRAFGVILSDFGLIVCLVAPTAVLLLVCLIPRARGWALQAAVASALASVALVVFVFGGITLLSTALSDP